MRVELYKATVEKKRYAGMRIGGRVAIEKCVAMVMATMFFVEITIRSKWEWMPNERVVLVRMRWSITCKDRYGNQRGNDKRKRKEK